MVVGVELMEDRVDDLGSAVECGDMVLIAIVGSLIILLFCSGSLGVAYRA